MASELEMTMRDHFAMHCDQPGMAEIVTAAGFVYSAGQVWSDGQTSLGSFDAWWRTLPQHERLGLYARVRYAMADAMLAARAEQPTPEATHLREVNAALVEALREAQSALALMVSPDAIRQSTVSHAYAQLTAAEAKARAALARATTQEQAP